MNFLGSMFYFLDTLTAFDTCCLIAIYSMFLLLFANACMQFKLSNVAECLHIIIFCVIIFTCFCLYLIDEKSFNILRNSSFLRTAYVTNIAVFSIYMIYNLCKNRGLFMIKNNSFECEQDCIRNVKSVDDNFKRKQLESSYNDKDGVYKDYNYYYRYDYDKYAEPYTSIPEISRASNVYIGQDMPFLRNKTRMNYCINNNFENYETNRRINNQIFKNRYIGYYSEDDFINDINLEENNFNYKDYKDNYNDDVTNTCEKINFGQSNNNVSCNNEMTSSAFNNSYDLCKESNVLDKVKNMLQENNASFDERISLVRVDMEKLRDSIQGIVDRITKMFELFTVVLQQQKSRD